MAFSNTSPLPMTDINTTPLVDVLLVLLIIFMITAPIVTQRLSIPLPVTGRDTIEAPPLRTVELRTTTNGDAILYFEQDQVDLTTLLAKLRADAQRDQLAVNLKTAMDVPYGELAQVVVAVRRAGIQNIRFDEMRAP